MKAITSLNNQCAIVYDGDCIQDASESMFEPSWWEQSGHLAGHAPGRGSALFIEASFGQAVLRQYLRGGWPARFSRERYIFTGFRRSRPFREFALLGQLHGHGLPVPAPLAAMCARDFLSYRGALLTRRLTNVATLDEMLTEADASSAIWPAVGACIARFHKAGVTHADLNARNILVRRDSGEVYLVDFDRSVFEPGRARDGKTNLARLYRSLQKLWPEEGSGLIDACWQTLLDGYHG
jgi:3-deoxy-D-manno-octulosonic acid kinase